MPSLVLLDEPLANLDYKLREELREELPKLFAASGSIFVYATTEPAEALLLGGNTATLSEGRITPVRADDRRLPQAAGHRHGEDLRRPAAEYDQSAPRSGRHRSSVKGRHLLPVPSHLSGIADGPYTVGFQPHHLSLARPHASAAVADGESGRSRKSRVPKVSFMSNAPVSRWVMLTHGIHDIEPDTVIDLFLDARHLMAFSPDGRAIGGHAAQAA